MRVVGLFSGVGGLELGLHGAPRLLCEVDPYAQAVLKYAFPHTPIAGDVQSLRALPACDVLAAGFPCQDLSQAGRTAGISGAKSGIVSELFRLVAGARRPPAWIVLENVPFMLQLQRGRAVRYLLTALEERNYSWAYRTVDTLGFGLPQRRRRVILVASREEDPRGVLFADDGGNSGHAQLPGVPCGFYWTEGTKGLGWAVDAVPPLKGGSGVGIPSPPAVLMPTGEVVTPSIEDAERLQGFEEGWTAPAAAVGRTGQRQRWKLVGNAVSVPVAQWIGQRLREPGAFAGVTMGPVANGRLPSAAWGHHGVVEAVDVSPFPVACETASLLDFLRAPVPLSPRATAGFLVRARASRLHFADGFLDSVEAYLLRSTETKSLEAALSVSRGGKKRV